MRQTATAWDTALRTGSESVTCDLPADAGFAQALCARADVVLEGFRPGVAARLGVGPGDVPASTVYCSITGFGDHGLHRLRAGHDVNYLGWAGVLEDTPQLPPTQVADLAAGALGAVTQVLAGLLERARTGEGPRITRLDDAPRARPRGAPGRRRARPEASHGRARVLPHLRDGRRTSPHRRSARAEVLHETLRARRPHRPRQSGSTTRIRRRSEPSSRPSSPLAPLPTGSRTSMGRTSASVRSRRAKKPLRHSDRPLRREWFRSGRTPMPGAPS